MMNTITRRNFLKIAGVTGVIGASRSLFPGWMPRLAFAADHQSGGDRDILINIFLRGGMDGLSAVVPYGEGREYYDNRPTIAVPEPGGDRSAIDLDGFFGLHPALAPLAAIYQQQDLAIVHASGLVHPTRSHFDAQHFVDFGVPGDKTIATGWIGRHLETASWQNQSPFRAVGMGDLLPDSLRGAVTPLALRALDDFHLQGRSDELQRMERSLARLYEAAGPQDPLSRQAKLVFETVTTVQQLTADPYRPAHGAVYPADDLGFGLALRQIAQIIKADIGLEVASLDHLGGWDTHEAQGTLDGGLNDDFTVLAQGLHAFYTDLGDRMKRVVVVVMSEFGRTIDENGSQGTDHGHGNAMFLMGGGVRGGKVYGDWPTLAPEARDDADDLAITTDYRHVLAEMLQRRLGNNAIADIFPGFSPQPLDIFNV